MYCYIVSITKIYLKGDKVQVFLKIGRHIGPFILMFVFGAK